MSDFTVYTKDYYNELEELKNNGELFPFEELTFAQLEKLWWFENNPVPKIAELFNVKKGRVEYKKNKWGMNLPTCLFYYEGQYKYPKEYLESNEELKAAINKYEECKNKY